MLSAKALGYAELNRRVRESAGDVEITDCFGERFIACGASDRTITVTGTPGNAMGAYLSGATVIVNGNAQDAVGDTMNAGRIVIHGNAGDALGYAMRGGEIYVQGNAGYRTGIHMKEYQEKRPVLVVGGSAGSFLGEYLAGGLIIVLGLDTDATPIGNFAGTGMHGGQIWIRSNQVPAKLPAQVCVEENADPGEILPYLETYARLFGVSMDTIGRKPFCRLLPNAKNPYQQLYTEN